MYRFGIAGIPLGSKGRTVKDAVENTFQLGLNHLEIQLFRVSVQDRDLSEFVGMKPYEIDDMLLIELLRGDEEGNYNPIPLDSTIEEGDIGRELFWSMARDYKELRLAADIAKELDVKITLHTPYYVDFANDEKLIDDSILHTIWGGILNDALDGEFIISHLGLVEGDRKSALKKTESSLKEILKRFNNLNIKSKLYIENSGHPDVLGTLDEIKKIEKDIKGIKGIVNIAHIYSLETDKTYEKDFFIELIENTKKEGRPLYFEFSGVEILENGEHRFTPIKRGNLKFEPLADAIADFDDEITIISFSPLLEHDALYMKVIFERSISKKIGKTIKPLP